MQQMAPGEDLADPTNGEKYHLIKFKTHPKEIQFIF